jgi:hypothetical protein
MSGAMSTIRLLLDEQGFEPLTNPLKGGFEPGALIDDADFGFDLGRIAEAIQELIAGEASFHLGVHLPVMLQHPGSGIEF